jgi:tetratricopeptide (TPR) repeat protein
MFRASALCIVTAAALWLPPAMSAAAQAANSGNRRVATAAEPAASSGKTGATGKVASPEERAQQIYTQTVAAFILHRDRAKAERGFLQVIRLDPRFAPAWFNLGVLSEGDKSWAKAKGYFSEYLRIEPSGPDAQRARSQVKLLSEYAAGTISPETAKQAEYDAMIQRARAFLAAGLFREAIAEAGRAEEANASRWEAYAVVSLCMARQRKLPEARKFEALAVNHAPGNKRAQVQSALDKQIAGWTH